MKTLNYELLKSYDWYYYTDNVKISKFYCQPELYLSIKLQWSYSDGDQKDYSFYVNDNYVYIERNILKYILLPTIEKCIYKNTKTRDYIDNLLFIDKE